MNIEALLAQASRLMAEGRSDQALALLDQVPPSLRRHAAVARLRASVLAQDPSDKARWREAEALFRGLERGGALDLGSAINFAILLKKIGKLDEARRRLEAVASRAPDTPGIDYNLGATHYEAGDWARAEKRLRAAFAADPNDLRARRGLAHLRLGMGDFEEGWPLYDARHGLVAKNRAPEPLRDVALWEGEPLDGRPLALWGEQGVGEEILFATLAPEMAVQARAEGGALSLVVDPRLAPLFARSFEGIDVRPNAPEAPWAGPLPALKAPLGSLGPALRPTAASFPAPSARLTADPERRAAMRDWLAGLPGRLRVGISWRSTMTRAADKKSIPLERWKPVLKTPDVSFVDLQYGEVEEDLAAARRASGVEIAQAPGLDKKDDLDGLAALIAELDMVVTISNVTAHLAGAVGTPVTLMLARSHFWYWGYRGEPACRWYPGMTVLRRESDSWGPVLRAAAERIARATRP